MKKRVSFEGTLLQSLCFAALLAPALRLIPRRMVCFAGRACWVSIFVAIPFFLLDIWFLTAFLKDRRQGEGLGEMITRALGPVFGKITAVLYSVWMVFYCGFILRSGADRFISSVYPSSRPSFFILIMAVMGLMSALSKPEAIVRAAKVLLPPVIAVLGIIMLLSLGSADFSELLPVNLAEPVPILEGALPLVSLTGGLMTYTCFLVGSCPKDAKFFKHWAIWLIPVIIFYALLCVTVVGNFGSTLTVDMSHPFFSMVRNVRIMRTIERIEAIVVALWVLPDFVLTSTLLIISSRSLMTVFGYMPNENGVKTDFKNGRFIIPLCAVGAVVAADYMAPNSFDLQFLSETVIPDLNMAFVFGLLFIVFIIGKIRGKI